MPSKPIEAIEPDPRRAGAVRVMVDGRAVLIVPAEAARREGLEPGAALGADSVGRLLDAADEEAAFKTAVRLLERRPFARRDLTRRLSLKGHPPAAVAAALERAERLHYLDDERYTRHFVQSKTARGYGPARLRKELSQRGVAAPMIERILAEEVGAEGAEQAIIALARKRAGQLGELPRPDRIRRVVAYLARRGYSGPEVVKLARQVG
jgi:regulatory protein